MVYYCTNLPKHINKKDRLKVEMRRSFGLLYIFSSK
jgi:hypothetical protein